MSLKIDKLGFKYAYRQYSQILVVIFEQRTTPLYLINILINGQIETNK
jgi:hypothetical protein